MKKTIALMLTALLSLGIGLSGCSDGINSNPGTSTDKNGMSVDPNLPSVQEGQIRINCAYSNAQNLWVWDDFAASEISKCEDWNTSDAVTLTGTNGDFKYFDVKLADNPKQVSFIIRSAKGDKKLTEKDLIFIFPNKYNEIYVVDGKIMVTTSDKSTGKVSLSNPKGLASGSIVDENTIKLIGDGISLNKNNIIVKNGDKTLTVSSISGMTLTTSESLKNYGMVEVSYTDEMGTDTITAIPDDTLLDNWFNMDITKLGYADGVFTTWAPLASKVQVLLYETAASLDDSTYSPKEIPMTRQSDGTWKTEDVSADVAGKNYYKYRIRNGNYSYDVCDIWAKVASKNSEATQIVSIDDSSAKPAGWKSEYENPFSDGSVKYYSDAIIYEMHIRDWSMAMDRSSSGSFDEIADAMKVGGTLYNHLKELGVTHVQILPMFEYAKVGSDDTAYNWGYNPYNWNTPETRYVKSMTDGTDAVKSMRSMIQAFHDAGIAVNMDVVYNHTSGTKNGSIYDMTVPKYFYRTNGDTYLNGSGCRNETNSEHEMFKKYMIDSLKHWMTDYHINGFRFDLMGVHDKSTMKDVYNELVKIDPNVMVYGEPWTAGDKNASIATEGAISVGNTNGVGAFDDDFRDAIKGAESGGFQKGQVQGIYNDSGIITGLVGDTGKNNRNTTGRPGLALHYVECHDNYTLYDKLNISLDTSAVGSDECVKYWKTVTQLNAEQKKLIKDQNKLSAAYVFLAQGTPFINGGQEFMRTKKGNPDSYAADTKGGYKWTETEILECNAIDLNFKETYSDVYNTYKGLIAFRKANSDAFGHNGRARPERISAGVTKYTTGDFLVYFNATDADYTIDSADSADYTKSVDVSSGTPTEAPVPTNVAPKSFVILKK
mgnify:CR=1 FL=1